MIIKGDPAGNVGYWSAHLQRDDTNERADVMEISGLLSTNLPSALREMEAIAAQSRSGGNFMYQANINPERPERLTEKQWREAIDTLENHLGLGGHQRVVVEHEKEGRVHRHVIWNRVDVETLRVADIGGNYYTHERVARTLELKFDLQRSASLHGERHPEGRPERAEELWEKRAAEKSGIDAKEIKVELTDLWRKTDSGKALSAAIEEKGYILAQGDSRAFCIVDQAGDAHSVARRIEGVKTKDVRERLADIDTAQLPTVEEARAVQREKYPTKEAARTAWDSRSGTYAHTPSQERDAPEERLGGNGDTKTPPYEKWHDRPATKMEDKICRIQNAANWGGPSVGAGLYAEGITLVRVDAAGKDKIQEDYQREFDVARAYFKADTRLRRASFEEGELVAVTQWGDVHRLNPRYIDAAKLEHTANGGSTQTPTLSDAREYFATAAQQRQQNFNDRAEAWKTIAEAKASERWRAQAAKDINIGVRETVQNVKDAGLKVMTAGGTVTSLSSFAEYLLGMGSGRQAANDSGDRNSERRRAAAALERIAESIERGENLRGSDLAHLTPTHLENIKHHGDDFLREMIADLERGRQRENEYGRARER